MPDEYVILIAQEIMKAAGIKLTDITPVDNREEALHVITSIAMVARNNPLIGIVEALGEIPPSTDIDISVNMVSAER